MATVEEFKQVSSALSNAKVDLVSEYFLFYRQKISPLDYVTPEFLQQRINITKDLFVDNTASTHVPESAKRKYGGELLALRSLTDGNCLYSAVSVRLVGNNSLIHILRILASLELFLNAKFYSRHPILQDVFENGKDIMGKKLFVSYRNVFQLARGLYGDDNADGVNNDLEVLVKDLAIHNCEDGIWSSFLCVLALSSVINIPINLFSVSSGLVKYDKLFNQIISPRETSDNTKMTILLLWTNLYRTSGLQKNLHLRNNHFLPLLVRKNDKSLPPNRKRKIKQQTEKPAKCQKIIQHFLPSPKSIFSLSKTTFSLPKTTVSLPKTTFTTSVLVKPTASIKTAIVHSTPVNKLPAKSNNTPCQTKITFSTVPPQKTLAPKNNKKLSNISTISFSSNDTTQNFADETNKDMISLVNNNGALLSTTSKNKKPENISTASSQAVSQNFSEKTNKNIISLIKNNEKKIVVSEANKGKKKKKPPYVSSLPQHPNDICLYRQKAIGGLTPSELYSLIKNVYKPDAKFIFPVTVRRFKYTWFQEFKWLCYSRWKDGAYCLPCVLFGHQYTGPQKLQNFYIEPFREWTDALRQFRRHESAEDGIHKSSQLIFSNFIAQFKGNELPIDKAMKINYKENVKKAREAIAPIVDTVKLCGRQNLPLRGHRDSGPDQPALGESGLNNPGNFIELLNYRVRGGDEALESHLKKAQQNAKYTSPDIQNELTLCFRDLISEKLINEVKDSKFYSILADEATDCSVKEQIALIFRFVDQNNDIREEFVSYLECEDGLSGKALFKTIKRFLDFHGLDILDCRGQGYDGAGAVAGIHNGLSACILKINSKAYYTHCKCHVLNLAVVSACSEQSVRNVMAHIKEISYFFNLSVPRTRMLRWKIKKHAPEATKQKLKDVCRTRWIERIDGMNTFEDLFVPVHHALLAMKLNNCKKIHFNNETSAKAQSLFKLIDDFNFIVTLVITRNILDYLLPVTRKLQGGTIDIAQSLDLIRAVKSTYAILRESVDYYHDAWYKIAVKLARKVEIYEEDAKPPRVCSRQAHRANPQGLTLKEYFRVTLTIPFLDHIIADLNTRFKGEDLTAYCGLYILPYIMFEEPEWKKQFLKFANFYQEDFPNFNGLHAEMDLWYNLWSNKKLKTNLPDSVGVTLKLVDSVAFPNIHLALKLLGTLPITTCECERSFSSLRAIKTWDRSTMTNGRLNGLALMYIHREIDVDLDDVIDLFANKSRRIQLK